MKSHPMSRRPSRCSWPPSLSQAEPSREAAAVCRRLLFDVVGLAIAARGTDYVRAALASAVGEGRCTALDMRGRFDPYDAALVNGTAAHGEDYDDTFEGGPVHAGAVIVPAVLAVARAARSRRRRGDARDRGRHRADVPAEPRGAAGDPQGRLPSDRDLRRAGGCGRPSALRSASAGRTIARALGISGSLASGIIEYLADGSSTKRLHAGAAAQAGLRAALLAEAGFTRAAHRLRGNSRLLQGLRAVEDAGFRTADRRARGGLGRRETLAFKPYACGTMTQPFIDCAIRLAAEGVRADDIVSIACKVGEGTVHRLWEPLHEKHRPPNGYAGKVLDALLHGGRLHRWPSRARAVHRRARPRSEGAGARCEDRLRDRSRRRVSAQFHRAPEGGPRRRVGAGTAPAPHARRRARAPER